jgi:hypothetical protein
LPLQGGAASAAAPFFFGNAANFEAKSLPF